MQPTATVDPLVVAQARAEQRVLAQYLVPCPTCGQPAAVHVDESPAEPVLVRLVCPTACRVNPAAALALIPSAPHRMSA